MDNKLISQCPHCGKFMHSMNFDGNGMATCSRCHSRVKSENYRTITLMANVIFFCIILPFNAVVFSGIGFWVADVVGAALAFIVTTLWLEVESMDQ